MSVRNPRLQTYARTLRNNPSPAERLLWPHLRALHPRFTRQHPVPPFILDFACREAHPAIELDGPSYDSRQPYDARRTALLEAQGWTVLRFSNQQVHEDPAAIAATIKLALESQGHTVTYRQPRTRARPEQ